jgi:hypothetical protein
MLAYVFWHWRYPHIEKLSYQQLLIDFHTALRAQKPVGFDYSTVFQVEHVPWLSMAGEAYEEWYILENSAALDALNEAAITGLCREPHQQAARSAAGGTAGLYRLRASSVITTAHVALWFAKPAGMSYETVYQTLQPQIKQSPGTLWERQMVLGPAPEFCLQTPGDTTLPANFTVSKTPLTQIWLG